MLQLNHSKIYIYKRNTSHHGIKVVFRNYYFIKYPKLAKNMCADHQMFCVCTIVWNSYIFTVWDKTISIPPKQPRNSIGLKLKYQTIIRKYKIAPIWHFWVM